MVVAALILGLGHIDIDVIGQLTAGDLLVGLGTLLLAFFTWRLARATYALDRRTTTREQERQERQVRGIARLVDGELAVVWSTIQSVIDTGEYRFYLPMPRGAWDRDGGVIAEAVTDEDAALLVTAFGRLSGWQETTTEIRRLTPDPATEVPDEVLRALPDLLLAVAEARQLLNALAYRKPAQEPSHSRWRWVMPWRWTRA